VFSIRDYAAGFTALLGVVLLDLLAMDMSIVRQLRSAQWVGNSAMATAYLVAYVLLDWMSYVQPILELGITPWSPQAGLTLAFLILRGVRWMPVTALGALIAEVMVRDSPAPMMTLIAASVVVAGGYGLAAYLLRPGWLYRSLDTPRGMVWLLTVSAATTLAVAVFYVGLFNSAGLLPQPEAFRSARRSWLGDLNGILTVAPVLLAVARRWPDSAMLLARRWEIIAQFGAVVLILWLVFGWGQPETVRLFYLLFLPVLWVAFRWGGTGAALCTLGVQVGLVITAPVEAEFPPVVDLQLLTVTLESVGLLIGVVVLQRAEALKQVAAQESEQRAIVNTAPDGILSTSMAGDIVSVNPAAALLFAAPQGVLIGQDIESCLPGILLQGERGRCSLAAKRVDQLTFPVDVAWAKIEAPAAGGFIFIVRDATERLTSQTKLRERDTALAHATRFAMLGELASAITHELNQPITALVSYVRAAQILAAPFSDQDPRLAQTLAKTSSEAVRTSVVLRRLRDFYRGGAPKRGPLSLEECIDTTLKSFEDRLRQTCVRVRKELNIGLPPLHCDQTQLEMVLINLLSNAVDALAQRPEGEREVLLAASCHDGQVMFSIEDSGPGLAADVQARLFDPFMTTKPDGMGLGLAISRSLLRSQEGDVWAQSSKLGGACFVVRLPTTANTQIAL
jgi:two-component system sensor kinase FixL